MGQGGRRPVILLPPPAGTILLYAADGLAAQRGDLGRAGKPRTPSREEWVPTFRALAASDDGLATLQDLTKAGMQAWGCPESLIRCLDDAFADITFRVLAIAALEDFMATAREPIPPPSTPAPGPEQPPEPPTPGPAPSLAPQAPNRPGPRSRNPTPKPS